MKPELLKEIAMIKRNISLLEDYVMPKDVSYSNITFADSAKSDKVNRNLLNDINQAAKISGANVRVGTITSTHPSKTSGKDSRHPEGNAVDIDMVNGKAVSRKIEDEVNAIVYQLEKMGYKKNVERGNEKSVLTFGYKDHDDHIHVSSKSEESSKETSDEKTSNEKTTDSTEKTDTSVYTQPEARFNLSNVTKAVQDFTKKFSF
jgi:hypothetical protein